MSTSLKKLMEQDAGRPVSPAPVDDVLAGGRTRLRRRRVLTIAAAVVVAVLAVAVPIGLVGDDSSVDEPVKHPERSDSLTFTREDGTAFTIDGARVLCPPPSQTETRSQAIFVLARAKTGDGQPSYFTIEGLLDEVADGATIRLPATFDKEYDDTPYQGSYFFAYDAENTNQLSSNQTEGVSGTLVFEHATCDPGPAIDVRIDATLAGEGFEGRQAQVEGRITLGYED